MLNLPNIPGVYIAETVHPKLRNNLIIIPDLFLAIGTLSACQEHSFCGNDSISIIDFNYDFLS